MQFIHASYSCLYASQDKLFFFIFYGGVSRISSGVRQPEDRRCAVRTEWSDCDRGGC